jgi:Phage integrase family
MRGAAAPNQTLLGGRRAELREHAMGFGVNSPLRGAKEHSRDQEAGCERSHKLDRVAQRIPGSRTKNKKARIVHLSEPAWKVIEACSGEPNVFGTRSGKRFQRFGKEKRAIDELRGISRWCHHDLRRTIVSGMARLGVPPHVTDKILNHQAGTISGVGRVSTSPISGGT